MRNHIVLFLTLAAVPATPVAAQLDLPTVGDILGRVNRTLEPVQEAVGGVAVGAARLAETRLDRLSTLLRRNRSVIERDTQGELARKGELLLLDPSEADLAGASAAGFALIERTTLDQLGIAIARLSVPKGMSLARAEKELAQLLPQAQVSADNLHLPSGGAVSSFGAAAQATSAPILTRVGVIDGAPGSSVPVESVQPFARGAPYPSNHGSAVVGLLRSVGVQRINVADVYGTDPAGGNALAITRGIDWLIKQKAQVISISLTGPKNALLDRAIGAARSRGVHFVAAVGNDGPAAPPAYPASYPGVIAVTAVDGRNRALIEAGRALHLDYAAPGADIAAPNAAGKLVRVRGTSYAVPLVAARAAAALASGSDVTVTLDREAIDLGPKGADAAFGRGLLCGHCRPGQR